MRVLIVEDDALLREGLVLLLTSEGFQVTSAVETAEDFLAALELDLPEVCVVDVRLPPGFTDEGLRAAVEARRRYPELPVLVLSAYVEERYAAELLSRGAGGVGYLLKERVSKVAEFVEALRRVAGGGTALDPEVVAQLLVRRAVDDPLGRLTPRERQILALMAEGQDNGGIARLLVITETAVSKHINNIFGKLDLPQGVNGHRRVLAVLRYLNT